MMWKRRKIVQMGLWITLLAALPACADDAPEGDEGGWSVDDRQDRIEVSPNPVAFETVQVGQEASIEVTISNIGDTVLRLTKIALKEDVTDVEEELFEQGEGWGEQDISLEPNQNHRVLLRHKPLNQVLDTGSIIIESDDPSNPVVTVPISTEYLLPRLEAPETVTFPEVWPNEQHGMNARVRDWEMIQVQNSGVGSLNIDAIRIKHRRLGQTSRFSFSIPQPTEEEIAGGDAPNPDNDVSDWPDQLGPGEQFDVRIWFVPEDRMPVRNGLVIESNDPLSPEHTVSLRANFGSPCLEASPDDRVEFPRTSVGHRSQKIVSIKNCNPNSELPLASIQLADGADDAFEIVDRGRFSAEDQEDWVLESGEQISIAVAFNPTEEREHNATLRVEADDSTVPALEVELNGRGTEDACPTAAFSASIVDGDAQPSSTLINVDGANEIQLDASASSSAIGGELRYEWTIISSPTPTAAQIMPPHDVRPTFEVDAVGDYLVQLRVYDALNTISCGEPAIMTIRVRPESDIYIQLSWTALGGVIDSDMDLHYLHPTGERWGSRAEGWDCYFGNRTPNWGGLGSSPTLILDNLRGTGPEAIRHSNLESVFYKVGAHHWSDHGNGPVDATVEVFFHGTLIHAARDRRVRDGQFWLVGLINGADHTVVPIDTISDGLPD